jgi:VWFA-related protein
VLNAEVEYRFPDRRGLRTLVQGAIRVAEAPEELTTYHLDGEVLRAGELFEHFRYRFQARPDRKVPFVFERPLRPGRYQVVLRLHNLSNDCFYREERTLEVPAVSPTDRVVASADPATPASAGVAGTEGDPAGSAAARAAPVEEPGLQLRLPSGRLMTGKLRVEAVTRGTGIARVAFALDGKPMLTKRRPPFGVGIDLGRSPRLHRIGAIAYDSEGNELARDEALINGGPHRFALRLVEPRSIPEDAERVVARAEIDVPEGERLERVEFYVNDDLHTTLFQPPYLQSLPVPRGASIAWIRTVAYLSGGGAAEDVRLIGSEQQSSQIDVDFVELHASVLDRSGRPVDDLREDEIRVYERGELQELRRMEPVADLPIHAGVLLDTSSSMAAALGDAERAALQFFSEVLTERDRAAVLTFADEPDLAVRFTSSLEILAGGLAALEPRGDTHLWDAVAYALHYFSGIRGKRAVVLITDGQDSGSKYQFEDVLEYARRTGVAFYVIGLRVPSRPASAGMLIDRLARETGGRSFRIGRAFELGRVYSDIRAELRSQYLIAYQSSTTDGESFREIDIELDRPGHEVRTVRGYYP